MTFHRGAVVICALSGELGKPRPAIVLQSDLFNATHPSVTVCPVTSHLLAAPLYRVSVKPGTMYGLKVESQVMVDKLSTIRIERLGTIIGRLEADDLARVEAAALLWLGLRP
jgi:mRNA interferase MazF